MIDRPAVRAAAAAVAALALASPGRAQDEGPKVTLGGVLDTRLARTDVPVGWIDGGLGKLRYGGADGQEAELARLAQAALLVDADLSEVLSAHVQLMVDAELDAGSRRGRVGLVQAFASWRPELSPSVRLRLRTGLMFPPVSLEHTEPAWNTAHTITPSAVNTWIGEEVRAGGAELSLVLKAGGHDLSATGGVFGMNDPAGSQLAWRGWALHDRQSHSSDELPFAPLPSLQRGGMFERQAPWSTPVREIDGRLGWYAGGGWRGPGAWEARALYYDNRGKPDVFDGRQYAWHTRFTALGLRLDLPGPVDLYGQHLLGETGMGLPPGGTLMVNMEFDASYALLSARAGRHRFTVRYDRFRAEDVDAFQAMDDNDEDGEAWTAAYLLETGARHRLALEWVRVISDRPARLGLRLPLHVEEDLFQASWRVRF